MPFYVSAEQQMRDKDDYARKGVARSRSSVALQYAGGILMVTPNVSTVLHKISEIYDRIAFAAVGRYNEYEVLRKAGVTYADLTGYSFDRGDVTARGLANWYAQQLGTSFTESMKPYEVEIVVAEVGLRPDSDQIYRIRWDGSVSDEPGFVAFGGQADTVSAALKERFSDDMSLAEALGAALDALSAPPPSTPASAGSGSAATAGKAAASAAAAGNGTPTELPAAQLEVAILDRARAHRTFRRLQGPRLEELIAESRAATAAAAPATAAPATTASTDAPKTPPAADDPPIGPSAGSDGIPKPPAK
ncbi:MAG: proteasome subunit alpha [Trebonia sp.]|jgi:proteasome alpha subunit